MVARSLVDGWCKTAGRSREVAKGPLKRKRWKIHAHYKKPLITIIHDLSEPAEAPKRGEKERERVKVATLEGGSR